MSDVMESYVKMGEDIGKPEHEVRDLARQLRAVYPDTWEDLLAKKLNSNKEEVEKTRRIEEKRQKIRALEIQLQSRDHAELEHNLDRRIVELEKANTEGAEDEIKARKEDLGLGTMGKRPGKPGTRKSAVPRNPGRGK